MILLSASRFLNLITWMKEETLMSFSIYFKICVEHVSLYLFMYISSYLLWSVYLQLHHPMPYLGLIMIVSNIMGAFGLRFILPSHLLAKKDFRHKLKIYNVYIVWLQVAVFLREILSYFFAKAPADIQFLVPIMVAGAREFDKRIQLRLITKMMGKQDEPGTVLMAIHVGASYSFFIAVRLWEAQFSTLCCTMAIDLVLHLLMTYQIIHEYRKTQGKSVEITYVKNNIKITMLIIAELIEGLTPIIYGVGMAMAYYGPNYHLFSNVGNDYWSTQMKSIRPLFVTMSMLFGIDTLSVLVNSFCLWKALNVNMVSEVCRFLKRYLHLMSISLAVFITGYFTTKDINLGMDGTMYFEWISQEGWIQLVNNSNVITNEQKVELLAQDT